MNRSVPAFILGLLFSIIGAIAAIIFYLAFIIIGAFTGDLFAFVALLPLLNILCFGIAFIGSIMCIVRRKIGGTMLIISSIISLACYGILLLTLGLHNAEVFYYLIPSGVLLLSGIIAFIKKKNKQNQ